MMHEVVPLVRRLIPDLLGDCRASVACVFTTRPKYLVFGARSSEAPACVVEFGDPARLTRTERILSELSARLPETVPTPICCVPWQNGAYVLIQRGLPGVPWFRLADGIPDERAWRALLDRTMTAMIELHAVIRCVPEWRGVVYPGVELQRQAAMARRAGIRLSDPVLRRVREWGETGGTAVRACWQHGDFSLNNVLVSRDAIAIIDFDEFGGTMVPLHDAFGLALSVSLSQSGACQLSRAACLATCVGRAAAAERVDAARFPTLLLHHLLWRINQCSGLKRRAALRETLLQWAHQLAETPEQFFARSVACT